MEQPNNKYEIMNSTYKMVFIGMAVAGLVTILTLGIAIAGGLWLDARFGISNHIITMILVIMSVPVTIYGLLWSVRFTTSRFMAPELKEAPQVDKLQEDADNGGN